MKDILTLLKEENRRLSHQAEEDWLTGLYNRMTVEEKINRQLKSHQAGVLFVLDVDNFKSINDRYGHLAGDQVLCGIARILGERVFRNDILGRIGGDEFVIFMNVNQGTDFINERCRQIKQQFLDLPSPPFIVSKLSVTVCGSSYQKGDDYQSLFDRADQSLIKEKRLQKSRPAGVDERAELSAGMTSLEIDMKEVARELSEADPQEGAFCQDYDCFVSIYRYVERRLKRVKSSVFSMLFTLTNEYGDFPDLYERIALMEEMHKAIQTSLRAGDVFTRYSSCQYLVMVADVTDLQTDVIAERIRGKFMGSSSLSGKYRIHYKRYPLAALGEGKTGGV